MSGSFLAGPPREADKAAKGGARGIFFPGIESDTMPSFRRHADGTVKADHLAVEHGVLDDVPCEHGVLPGRPSLCGKGTIFPSASRTASGRSASMGVLKRPGAIVMTRTP